MPWILVLIRIKSLTMYFTCQAPKACNGLHMDLRGAPNILKADIWTHFVFYKQIWKHELEKPYAVCKAWEHNDGFQHLDAGAATRSRRTVTSSSSVIYRLQ